MGRRYLRRRGRGAALLRKHAGELDAREAALLATSLPNPIERDPAHPKPFQRRLAAALEAKARRAPELTSCVGR
jgi:monofunctional biosynthetic peptidoglycan transglycosylase